MLMLTLHCSEIISFSTVELSVLSVKWVSCEDTVMLHLETGGVNAKHEFQFNEQFSKWDHILPMFIQQLKISSINYAKLGKQNNNKEG